MEPSDRRLADHIAWRDPAFQICTARKRTKSAQLNNWQASRIADKDITDIFAEG